MELDAGGLVVWGTDSCLANVQPFWENDQWLSRSTGDREWNKEVDGCGESEEMRSKAKKMSEACRNVTKEGGSSYAWLWRFIEDVLLERFSSVKEAFKKDVC
ncbi:hypothetical protein AKJ16_DCAP26165 [Drosera capensis]